MNVDFSQQLSLVEEKAKEKTFSQILNSLFQPISMLVSSEVISSHC